MVDGYHQGFRMNDTTFVKYFKELYPSSYDFFVMDFEKKINKKKGRKYNELFYIRPSL